jgi:MOSC domain-containing protein YiiM
MHQALFPGWSRVYARILQPGTLRPGDPVELVVPLSPAAG